ncbi:hypothetical protein C2G38_2253755 [Gigaspora rosea]|uniref:Uncharacterized protein n=1 Tax=Gigaspora rosea TaxID=44941 RepID=A0A397U772_9GLOM|nr:hypothetical protein C2G38_2253755 [Gigaspora rosea]
MALVKYREKINELVYTECSRVICNDTKKTDDEIKLWREAIDVLVINAGGLSRRKAYGDWEIGEALNEFLVHLAFNVHHVQEAKELLLKAEEWIDGTKAYGSIDYSISIEEVLVLVQEVKKDDFEKGTAQNIARIHSAIEIIIVLT